MDVYVPRAPEEVGWRARWHDIIFGVETPAGKAFDVVLLVLIVGSVLAVMLESVAAVAEHYGGVLRIFEWVFTVLFSIEYGLRLVTSRRPGKYVFSFFGVVDVLSIVPTYISVLMPGAQSLLVVRALRLLRVFRILKLGHFLHAAEHLTAAVQASTSKIVVFLGAVVTVALVAGSMLYFIEGADSGFTSIPRALYWAIVTMTTVGYGDISPTSVPGQAIAAVLMILGYGIIAVPTGIVSAEIVSSQAETGRQCPNCQGGGHEPGAVHCKHCGEKL